MTEPAPTVAALVARLRELATPERAKHGVPQDVAMLECATALQAESARADRAEREAANLKSLLQRAERNELEY